jgi:hypothetical protein
MRAISFAAVAPHAPPAPPAPPGLRRALGDWRRRRAAGERVRAVDNWSGTAPRCSRPGLQLAQEAAVGPARSDGVVHGGRRAGAGGPGEQGPAGLSCRLVAGCSPSGSLIPLDPEVVEAERAAGARVGDAEAPVERLGAVREEPPDLAAREGGRRGRLGEPRVAVDARLLRPCPNLHLCFKEIGKLLE